MVKRTGEEETMSQELSDAPEKSAEVIGIGGEAYGGISIAGFLAVVLISFLIFAGVINFLSPPSSPTQIKLIDNPISTCNRNLTACKALTPGAPGYNEAASQINFIQAHPYLSNLRYNAYYQVIFFIIVIILYVYSHNYVSSSTKMSPMVYAYIFTSLFGWGAVVGILNLLLIGGAPSYLGGFGGVFFSYWKLTNKGFLR